VKVVSLDSAGNVALASATPAGIEPEGIAIDAAGAFAYVANATDGTVSTFSRDPGTGALTVQGAPVLTSGAGTSCTIAAGVLYVTCSASNRVDAFAVHALTAELAAGTAAGDLPVAFALDASGQFAYVANEYSNFVSAFTVGASLTANGQIVLAPDSSPMNLSATARAGGCVTIK
jgi:6-phosphogluconolactonase